MAIWARYIQVPQTVLFKTIFSSEGLENEKHGFIKIK